MSNKLFSYYKDLADKAQIKLGTKESMEWFREKLRKRSGVSHGRVTEGRKTSRIEPGKMFTYVYDAKTKKQLPYWDETPLIIVLDVTKDGWYGANLHYLPPTLRAILLYEIRSKNKTMSQIVSALTSNKYTLPCLKRYLSTQIKSKPVLIPRDEWEIAIQMPFESFIKATKTSVWKDSRRKAK